MLKSGIIYIYSYFSDWSTKDIKCILPFGYNVHAAATYAYAPAFKKFQHQIKETG